MSHPETPRRLTRFAALLLVAAALGACPRGGTLDDDTRSALAGRFLHAEHLATTPALTDLNGGRPLSCGDCHASTAANGYTAARPGSADHTPCASCHKGAFYTAPGPFCLSCHTTPPDPRRPKPADHALPEWPRRQKHAELVGRFNHRLHLEDPRITATGALQCTDCHTLGDGAYATIPSHAVCAGCHAENTRLSRMASPRLDACAACHADGGPGRARRYLTNDIGFTHAKHRRHPDGTPIDCLTCHTGIERSTSARAADVTLPKMVSCRQCHDDATRTPDRVRMSECGVCHRNPTIELRAAPGTHTAHHEASEPGRRLTALP